MTFCNSNSLDAQDLKEYLFNLDAPKENKNYTFSFYKKLSYLDYLQQHAASQANANIVSGYGNANASIVFVFQSPPLFKEERENIDKLLERFSINIWDIWITFIDKFIIDYPQKYFYLAHELDTIDPKLVYVFSRDNAYQNIMQALKKCNISIPNIFNVKDVNSNHFNLLSQYS